MCPQGDVCDRCGDKAVIEIHWREWATKLCSQCAPAMLRSVEHPPVQMIPISREPHSIERWRLLMYSSQDYTCNRAKVAPVAYSIRALYVFDPVLIELINSLDSDAPN